MGNMLSAKVHIRGIRPMLWHKFGPESIPLEKQERTGVAGHDPQEWKRTVLYTKHGQLYIPASYVFGAWKNGANMTQKGLQTPVVSTLQVMEEIILINRYIPNFNGGLPEKLTEDPEEPVYLDIRGVKNPANRARNIRYRVAASPGWEAQFTLLWDATIVQRDLMHAIGIDAGRLVGIGDGRKIGFGRFDLLSFEVEEVA